MTVREEAEILFFNFATRDLAQEVCKYIITALEEIDDGQTPMPYDYWYKVIEEIDNL